MQLKKTKNKASWLHLFKREQWWLPSNIFSGQETKRALVIKSEADTPYDL